MALTTLLHQGNLGAVGCAVGLFYLFYCTLRPRLVSNAFKSETSNIDKQPNDRDSNAVDDPNSQHIITLLQNATKSCHSLKIYSPGSLHTYETLTYQQLYDKAKVNARQLRTLSSWSTGCMCVLLVDDHLSNTLWFWSITTAGGIPVMCPPYAPKDLKANLRHLSRLLVNPICLTTRARLQNEWDGEDELDAYAIEDLAKQSCYNTPDLHMPAFEVTTTSPAMIMLTSGSSGNSKAVPLSHHQISSCIAGKSHVFPDGPNATVLNWIGLDHVAGLVEAHLRALSAGVDQVHVHAQDVTSEPAHFLRLLGLHKASSSFAPHFLLARLVDEEVSGQLPPSEQLDLQYLRIITSGGEACSTDVCRRFSLLLQQYGAPDNVVTPGFGMTETGAGCIFNKSCPQSDLQMHYDLTAVGSCAPGVEARITSLTGEDNSGGSVNTIIPGNLEIRGSIVFKGYLNNDKANSKSFTPDGWFRTGDMGFIDRQGHLVLTGRSTDVMCINGVKHLPVDQERAIEEARIPGVVPNHVVCFAWRPSGAHTEQCCVVYQYSFNRDDTAARVIAQRFITKEVLMNTGARPHVLPLPSGVLHKSTLGKLSRAKIRAAFEQGLFADEDDFNAKVIQEASIAAVVKPQDEMENTILDIVATTLRLDPTTYGVETDYFDAGMTSVDLFRLRSQICRHFDIANFGIEILIKHNTVRSLKQAIMKLSGSQRSTYEPVVQLKSSGDKTPLWLVHPGVGEVLVFVGLAHHVQDRPVFALRARGFEDGDQVFRSIDEAVLMYVEAIRLHQPHGPYAIAGYSYGSMLAFEISKRLEASGEKVPFLGCLNLPPHIKDRMKQLKLQNCLIHLSLFLRLINDEQAIALETETALLPYELCLEAVLSQSDQARLQDLALTSKALSRWAHVAFSLQSMATDYEPSASTENIDVFYCEPLAALGLSKQEWLERKLSEWGAFSRTLAKFHSVGGGHYTMLSPAHVRSFHRVLISAISSRGL